MNETKPSFISELIEKVIHRIELRLSNSNEKQLNAQEYIELNALFQEEVLVKAFRIIDTQSIVSYRQEDNPTNELIEISYAWSSQSVFKLFPNINFCHCSFFEAEILNACSEPLFYTCEHVLAALLARILNKLKIIILSKHKFNFIHKQIALQD